MEMSGALTKRGIKVTVDEFSDYDLSYSPPFSSPWDPVQMAVQKIESLL